MKNCTADGARDGHAIKCLLRRQAGSQRDPAHHQGDGQAS